MGKGKTRRRSSGAKVSFSLSACLLVIIGSFFLALFTVSALGVPLSTASPPISTTIKEILDNPDPYLGLTVSVEGYLTYIVPEGKIGGAVYLTDGEGNMIETYGPPPVGLPYGEPVNVVGQVTLDRNLEKVLLQVRSIYHSGQTVYQSAGGGEVTTVTVTATKTVTVTISGTATIKQVTVTGASTNREATTPPSLMALLGSPTFLTVWIIYAIIGFVVVAAVART